MRSWVERSLTPSGRSAPAAARPPAPPPGRRRLAAEVERLDPEQRAVGPVGERLLVDVERHERHPAEPVRAADDQRDVAAGADQHLAAPRLDLFELRDQHRRRAGGRDRLGRAGERLERLEVVDPLLAGRHGRQHRAVAGAVAEPRPVRPDRDDQVPAAPTQSSSAWPPEAFELRHQLAVVGVEHHRLGRVVAVPAARAAIPASASSRATTTRVRPVWRFVAR